MISGYTGRPQAHGLTGPEHRGFGSCVALGWEPSDPVRPRLQVSGPTGAATRMTCNAAMVPGTFTMDTPLTGVAVLHVLCALYLGSSV